MENLTPITLATAQTITNVVDKVIITANVHNDEQGTLEHHYMTLLTDGTPYKRGAMQYATVEERDAFWAKVDTEVAAGSTVRDALNSVAQADVLAKIASA